MRGGGGSPRSGTAAAPPPVLAVLVGIPVYSPGNTVRMVSYITLTRYGIPMAQFEPNLGGDSYGEYPVVHGLYPMLIL